MPLALIFLTTSRDNCSIKNIVQSLIIQVLIYFFRALTRWFCFDATSYTLAFCFFSSIGPSRCVYMYGLLSWCPLFGVVLFEASLCIYSREARGEAAYISSFSSSTRQCFFRFVSFYLYIYCLCTLFISRYIYTRYF